MITNCPACKKLISVQGSGSHSCKKCGAAIYIGDPLKDEENRVVLVSFKEEDGEGSDSDNSPDNQSVPKENKSKESPQSEEKEQSDDDEDVDYSYVKDVYEKNQKADSKYDSLKGVAWDRVQELGFFEAIYQTSRDLILTPTLFFIDMKYVRERKFIPFYGILFAIIGSLFRTFWMLYLVKEYLPQLKSIVPPENAENIRIPETADVISQILFMPIANIMLSAIILFAISSMLGAKTRSQHFYRLVGFVSLVDFFYIIPGLGNIIVFIWQAILIIKGLRIINMFSTEKAVGAYLLFISLSFLLSTVLLMNLGVK